MCLRQEDLDTPSNPPPARGHDWYDISFGLLDGWWLADDRTAYPLQAFEPCMANLAAAGLVSASCSLGQTRESSSQHLLVACNRHWDVPPGPASVQAGNEHGHDAKQDSGGPARW